MSLNWEELFQSILYLNDMKAIKEAPALIPPTENEIELTLQAVQDRLEEPGMKLEANESVRLGYEAAVDILADDIRDYKKIPGEDLKTDQSRAVAVLAVDFLNGEVSAEVLLGVPVKVPIEMRLKK